MPRRKQNPDKENAAWLGGFLDKGAVQKFEASYYRYCAECRERGEPVPTKIKFLEKLIDEHC